MHFFQIFRLSSTRIFCKVRYVFRITFLSDFQMIQIIPRCTRLTEGFPTVSYLQGDKFRIKKISNKKSVFFNFYLLFFPLFFFFFFFFKKVRPALGRRFVGPQRTRMWKKEKRRGRGEEPEKGEEKMKESNGLRCGFDNNWACMRLVETFFFLFYFFFWISKFDIQIIFLILILILMKRRGTGKRWREDEREQLLALWYLIFIIYYSFYFFNFLFFYFLYFLFFYIFFVPKKVVFGHPGNHPGVFVYFSRLP